MACQQEDNFDNAEDNPHQRHHNHLHNNNHNNNHVHDQHHHRQGKTHNQDEHQQQHNHSDQVHDRAINNNNSSRKPAVEEQDEENKIIDAGFYTEQKSAEDHSTDLNHSLSHSYHDLGNTQNRNPHVQECSFGDDQEVCKRKSRDSPRDEVSHGGSQLQKKQRNSASPGEFKKDREEWSDSAIGCLLGAYTKKYLQLNRGNLRGRDWEEVACIVSQRCEGHKCDKTVDQCKNKVDNLKKRYKSERQRMNSGNLSVSHWPWFNMMDVIAVAGQAKAAPDEDRSVSADGIVSVSLPRPAKKFAMFPSSQVALHSNSKTKTLSSPRWHRVLLKISGSAFTGNAQNVDPKVIMLIAREIAAVKRLGVEVAIVVGGRNFFSGSSWVGSTFLDRASADQIGMMATVMNSIILQASLENIGIQTRVQTAFKMSEVAEPYIRRRAIRHLEKGRVVIFGAGTGNPFCTTDTAAALRASEINADVVLKGTNVDGICDCDSRKGNAILDHISYRDLASKGLPTVMDLAAITLCEKNCIPVVVFNILEAGNISRALSGDRIGTFIDKIGNIS